MPLLTIALRYDSSCAHTHTHTQTHSIHTFYFPGDKQFKVSLICQFPAAKPILINKIHWHITAKLIHQIIWGSYHDVSYNSLKVDTQTHTHTDFLDKRMLRDHSNDTLIRKQRHLTSSHVMLQRAYQGWRKQFYIGQANPSSTNCTCVESKTTYRI